MEKFTEVSSDFAIKLFKKVSHDEKNSFLSPASIQMALAMTYAGAEGNTKEQMNKAMFAGLTDEEVNQNLHKFVEAINKPNDAYVLRTANRLYIEKSYEVLQTYLDVIRKHFHSDCVSSDFKAKSKEVRQEINQWVEQQTNDKIKDLLSSEAVSPDTRLILVNAVYFKGDWKKPFEESKTEKKPFHVTQNKKIDVDMMHSKDGFKFASTEKCQVLGIPYESEDLTMFFILPAQPNGLQALENEITGPALLELFRAVYSTEVKVSTHYTFLIRLKILLFLQEASWLTFQVVASCK